MGKTPDNFSSSRFPLSFHAVEKEPRGVPLCAVNRGLSHAVLHRHRAVRGERVFFEPPSRSHSGDLLRPFGQQLGGEVDYYLGSETVEKHDKLAEHYSSRPGTPCPAWGHQPTRPTVPVPPRPHRHRFRSSSVAVGTLKVGAPLLHSLRRIVERVGGPERVLFRISVVAACYV